VPISEEAPPSAPDDATAVAGEVAPAAAGEAEPQPVAMVDDAGGRTAGRRRQAAFIEIWRPGAAGRPNHDEDRGPRPMTATARRPPRYAGRSSNSRQPRRPASGQAAWSRAAAARFAEAPQPRARRSRGATPADPDSPFAALAALKAQLEGKGDGS
jgi:ATP-dependent RNA helicase SUPV3L1/SUV3